MARYLRCRKLARICVLQVRTLSSAEILFNSLLNGPNLQARLKMYSKGHGSLGRMRKLGGQNSLDRKVSILDDFRLRLCSKRNVSEESLHPNSGGSLFSAHRRGVYKTLDYIKIKSFARFYEVPVPLFVYVCVYVFASRLKLSDVVLPFYASHVLFVLRDQSNFVYRGLIIIPFAFLHPSCTHTHTHTRTHRRPHILMNILLSLLSDDSNSCLSIIHTP